jgi:preprotein translocase subunit SecA
MTGTAETEASELWEIYKLDVVVIPTNRPIVRDDREDIVFKTAREKFNRVIEDIVKMSEAGRPVLVGTTSVDVSEKLSRMLNMRGISHNVLNAKQHQREAEVVAEAGRPGKVTIATNMAGRGTDIKINDEVKKPVVWALSVPNATIHVGLTASCADGPVVREIRVLLSFMCRWRITSCVLFQSERIAKLMDRMGHKDGEVIQHSMVSKSIERAQKRWKKITSESGSDCWSMMMS